MYVYRIEETLREVPLKEALAGGAPYAAVMSRDEWLEAAESFAMGIDLDLELEHPLTTKAEVNIDSLTGSFSIPDRKAPQSTDYYFAFALDEKGIVFIDDGGYSIALIRPLIKNKRWKYPSLERFLYDFLENIVKRDLPVLEAFERRLSRVEERILDNEGAEVLEDVARIRGDLLALRTHYEQLLDLGQELGENENGFFEEKNLRYFDMFCARIMRLQDYATTLREITVQARDLYQSQLSEKQNRIMTILTVVTTIFTPLTLVTGWYGMNFKYMPELEWEYSYPIVFLISLAIALGCLLFFKLKKWL